MRITEPNLTVPALLVLATLAPVACTDTSPVTEPTGLEAPVAGQALDANLVCVGALTPFSECAALVALYNTTDGPNWADNSGWETDPDPCAWAGVTCWGDGSVQQINLIDQDLNGTLPAAIGDFPRLRQLRIFRSPNLTGPLPVEIADLTDMDFLALRRNGLSGGIPPALGTLPNLEHLDFTDNQLSGAIPVELADLAILRSLSLSENQLTGSIPAALGTLSNLGSLALGGNQLTGPIPAELSNLAQLSFLGLYDNQLTGSIPAALGDLDVEVLRLEENGLTGPIPPELAEISALRDLELYDNDLTGDIPPELGGLAELTGLRLDDNQLTGPIPPSLGNLAALRTLLLDDNQLSGAIPDHLTQLTDLSWLELDGNQLEGQVSLGVAAWAEPISPCEFVPGNPGLYMPDVSAYRVLDGDESGDICGLPFSSAEDVGQDTVEDIEDLVPESLGEGQANALISKIENAVAKADNGQYQAAINQMVAFLNQLADLVARGVLTPAEAQPLMEQAEALIDIWTEEL